jgi:outer membrane immunogenic protein
LKNALVRQAPVWCARWVAPFVPALLLPISAVAQSSGSQPYSDPYRSGPARPLDGSARGVYSAQPAPRYGRTARDEPAPLGYRPGAGAAETPPIWRGLYAGLQGGYRWTNADATSAGLAALTPRGAQFGGHIGSNYQTGNIVLGLEGDLMVGSASASTASLGTSFTTKDSWTSSLRGRAGYSFGPALLYATGGLAVAGQDVTLKTTTLSAAMNDARVGFVVGAGLEMMLTQQLSARVEGLRYSYRDSVLNFGGVNQSVKQDSNVLRAGVSYRFN